MIDAVVTHHADGFRSGVARFNELLARRLDVPLLTLDRLEGADLGCPLLSFKAREVPASESERLERLFGARSGPWELFLHEYADLPLERLLVSGARRIHCGNLEIEEAVRGLNPAVNSVWTPGLIVDERAYRSSEISVFSFGMAHKIRTDMFRRLRDLLERSGRGYTVYVSAANHETSSLRDAELVFDEMHEIFPDALYFLGNLSDVAVFNQLRQATFFAAFFQGGVRANNTSVASALELGAVVITNLDEHSPREYRHMDNLLDIERLEALPHDPSVLAGLRDAAVETGRRRSWDALVERLR